MHKRSPAFSFYPDKWLAGTMHLTDKAYRAYHRLLCWMWLHNTPPYRIKNDREVLRNATGLRDKSFDAAWTQIEPLLRRYRNHYHSAGLRKEYESQQKYSAAGRAGATARWPHEDRNAIGMASVSDSVSKGEGGSTDAKASAAIDAVVTAWNDLGEPFPQARLTQKRRKTIPARYADKFWREHWQEALERVKASSFCRGDGDKGWIANLDWFLRPDTVTRILEGQYDDRKGGGAPGRRRPEPGKYDNVGTRVQVG